ncbi:MAG: YeaH/YhbH family protein [Gammaproteobacteria bacterium]
MSQFIDRRLSGKNKSTVNRQRFLKRYRQQIKKAVEQAISKRSITDTANGEKISISQKDINEPKFYHGGGGINERIFPGNNDFITGDHIKRPPQGGGQGQGSQASNEGEGEDNFVFEISQKEFLDLFFEDLALPDLIKKQIAQIPEYKTVRAGFTTSGVPTNVNIVRSIKQATARRIATGSLHRKNLHELENKLAELLALNPDSEQNPEIIQLKNDIAQLKTRLRKIPFLDTVDLRFNNKIKQPSPSTQAVMFCLMDVSGSMDEVKKEIAKRFFILLYLFLNKNYERIEIVFIRHHTSAKEVDEQEFFYSRETGGTVVSSALELMRDIIYERYPTSSWNIYGAQASDGDNWNADSPYCQKILSEEIMPFVQYFAYIEIMPRHHQSLWEAYQIVTQNNANFAMQHIDQLSDIYPVFRELFKKEMV